MSPDGPHGPSASNTRKIMSIDVLVPPLGQTVDTVTFVTWYKREGDTVKPGEPLFAIETDKATLDVESPAGGILRGITAQAGDAVKALSVIATITGPKEELVPKPATAGSSRVQETARNIHSAPVSPPPAQRIFISPRARGLAEREGASISELRGTGPEGAIVERDVRAYLAEHARRAISPVARRLAGESGLDWERLTGTGPRGQITREDVESAIGARNAVVEPATPLPRKPAEEGVAPLENRILETIPVAGIRAVIAERMLRSAKGTAPVTLTCEVDAGALVALRASLSADGIPVTYNDLLLRVLARALQEHSRLNASLDGDKISVWARVDIGLAVDTERGLLVPVVRDVGTKGLAELAAETRSLAERARAGTLAPDELRAGTFTLTNLGMYGIDAFTPIINLPECAILGVGRIASRPAYVDGKLEERKMAWLSLTFDHRLVDGGPAARFFQRVVQLIEKPHLLLT